MSYIRRNEPTVYTYQDLETSPRVLNCWIADFWRDVTAAMREMSRAEAIKQVKRMWQTNRSRAWFAIEDIL